MTTKKTDIVPGVILKVTKDGDVTGIFLSVKPGGMDGTAIPSVGDYLTVLSYPSYFQNIHIVKLQYKGCECYGYYSHIRYKTVKV